MTFENNTIVDMKGMCEVFRALKGFEKLESLNFRCNNNFTDDCVAALADGINLKKELRVSRPNNTTQLNYTYLIDVFCIADSGPGREWHI